jgi:hypothetical protein
VPATSSRFSINLPRTGGAHRGLTEEGEIRCTPCQRPCNEPQAWGSLPATGLHRAVWDPPHSRFEAVDASAEGGYPDGPANVCSKAQDRTTEADECPLTTTAATDSPAEIMGIQGAPEHVVICFNRLDTFISYE